MIQKIVAQQALVRENVILRKALKREYRFRDLVSKSPAMQATLELARTAARSPSTILVLGESGTGKELLARAIHAESPRHARPFVAVSCAALTETLLESELFGHEKGAFTGARRAARGSSRWPTAGRSSSTRSATSARSSSSTSCASSRSGSSTASAGRARPGRRPDHRRHEPGPAGRPSRRAVPRGPLLPAQRHPDHAAAAARPQGGHPAPRRALPRAAWRGDEARDRGGLPRGDGVLLAHTGRATSASSATSSSARSSSPRVRSSRPHDLGLTLRRGATASAAHPASLEEVERHHIASVLRQTDGNVTQAARILDIDRVTLYNKIRKYGLKRAEDGEFEPATPNR